MRVLVLVPTTGSLSWVVSIEERPELPASQIIVRHEPQDGLSKNYNGLTSIGGVFEKLGSPVRPGRYMLRLAEPIESGNSWELPVILAHLVVASGHELAEELSQADMVLWSTGAVAPNLRVEAHDYRVAHKVAHSRNALQQAAAGDARIIAILPAPSDGEDASPWCSLLADAGAQRCQVVDTAGAARSILAQALGGTVPVLVQTLAARGLSPEKAGHPSGPLLPVFNIADVRLPAPQHSGERPVAAAERQTITRAFFQLLNAPAVVILAQDQEGLWSSAVVREIRKHAIERFGDKAVHLLNPGSVTEEDGVAPYYASMLAQLGLPIADPSPMNFRLRLAERLKDGKPMCLLFTGVERGPLAAITSLCNELRALNDEYGELRILMCGGERLCDMRYAQGALSRLSHAQEEHWPDPDIPEIQAEASAQGCGVLESGLIVLLQDLAGGHFGLIRELLLKVKAGVYGREALTRAVLDSPAIWTAVTPLLAGKAGRARGDAGSSLRSFVDRSDLGEARPYIFNATLRRLFWRNLVKRHQSEDDARLVWRSPAINEAVRRIIRSSEEADTV
jgi:hypothetical protein